MTFKVLSPEDLSKRAQLLGMPPNTLFNAPETSLVTGISVGALANRRAHGMWPHPVRIPGGGRIVRYRHSDLLVPGSVDAISSQRGGPSHFASPAENSNHK
jgi:hypothetical protein